MTRGPGNFSDENTQLTRQTIATILRGINVVVFSHYKMNPEDFIRKVGTLINEQKATVIVEHLAYNPLEDTHSIDIFTQEKKEDLSKGFKANRHIYDYVFTDSTNERTFVGELDASNEVVVYAKLPKSFHIPTPVGNYNPDWAIAFQAGKVKHIYGPAQDRRIQDRMRPQVFRQNHFRPGEIRRGQQLRKADGTGEVKQPSTFALRESPPAIRRDVFGDHQE
jgi:type III restriction enzyme